MGHVRLLGRCGAGLDPCAALRTVVTLEPGMSTAVVCLLGQAGSEEELDGRPLEGNTVPLERAFIKHRLRVIMGTGPRRDMTSGPA